MRPSKRLSEMKPADSGAPVPLARIETADPAYRVTAEQAVEGLADCMDAVGLLHPPILVARRPDFYGVVSGFRRIRAAERLGWSEIPARVLPTDADPLLCASLAVADNAQQRALCLIEQTRAVSLLAPFFEEPGPLAAHAARLGLSMSPQLVCRLSRLNRLSPEIRGHIEADAVPMSVALELETLDRPCAEAASRLFFETRPTLNEQKEILGLARDIARSEGKKLRQVLFESGISEVRADPQLSRREKIKQIRRLLNKRRYPWIHRYQERFEESRRALCLPDGAALEMPRDFEAEGCMLRISFASAEELASHLDALQGFVQSPHLAAILDKGLEDPHPLY